MSTKRSSINGRAILSTLRIALRSGAFVVTGLLCAAAAASILLSAEDASAADLDYLHTEDALIGHWTFDDTEGDVFLDSSTHGNDAEIVGNPAFKEGYLGERSVVFSMEQHVTGGYMIVPSTDSTNRMVDDGQFSMAFWHYGSDLPFTTGEKFFILKEEGLFLSLTGDNGFKFNTPPHYSSFGSQWLPNTWVHIAFTVDNGNVIFYINGEERGRTTIPTEKYQITEPWRIGNVQYYIDFTPTQLDDFRLYSRVLNQREIQYLADMVKQEETPPSRPANVETQGNNNQSINLIWESSTDNIAVKGYRIYVDGNEMRFTSSTTSTVYGLEPDTTYSITVRAEDLAGNLSAPSAPIQAKTDKEFTKEKVAVGINLAGVSYWNEDIPFVNVMKLASPWDDTTRQDEVLDLDEQGYVRSLEPGQSINSIVLVDNESHYPHGDYLLLYDGEGEIRPLHGVTIKEREPGRILFTDGGGGIFLEISEVNPDDYIRNVRVILPGYHDGRVQTDDSVFNRGFLAKWQDFKSLRFMDWMLTNEGFAVTWENRNKPDDYTQSKGDGASIEYMVELANTLHADPWFNIPTRADDEYVRNFAAYVAEHLNPELRAYVEWSNETWNTIFVQNTYSLERGRALGFPGSDYDIITRYHAHRAKEIFQIWEEEFEDSEQLVKVLGGFYGGGSYYADNLLTYEDVYRYADAYAIAPYFDGLYGSERAEWVKQASMDEVFADLTERVNQTGRMVKDLIQAVEPYGLSVIAYEGGQHLAGGFYDNDYNDDIPGVWYPDDNVLTEKLTNINREPRMGDMYRLMFDRWKEAGGELFMHFSSLGGYSKWGSWGLIERYDQPLETAYKYEATLDWLHENPVWWRAESGEDVDPPDGGGDPDTDPDENPGTNPGENPGTDPGENPGTDPGTNPGVIPGGGGGNVPPADEPSMSMEEVLALLSSIDKGRLALPMSVFENFRQAGKELQYRFNDVSIAFSPEGLPLDRIPQGYEIEVRASTPPNRGELLARASGDQAPLVNAPVIEFAVTAFDPENASRTLSIGSLMQAGLRISIALDTEAQAGIRSHLLAPYRYMEGNDAWERIAGSRYDADSGTISFDSAQSGIYAIMETNVPFLDIQGRWSQAIIEEAYANGLVNGTSGTRFDPAQPITRAQFAALLVQTLHLQTEELPGKPANHPFLDVGDSAWYTDSIVVAYQHGLIAGTSDTAFQPDAPLSREQMVTLLGRVLNMLKQEPEITAGLVEQQLSIFKDKDEVAPWALNPLALSVEKGLISGTSASTFSPKSNATREEAVKIMLALFKLYL